MPITVIIPDWWIGEGVVADAKGVMILLV